MADAKYRRLKVVIDPDSVIGATVIDEESGEPIAGLKAVEVAYGFNACPIYKITIVDPQGKNRKHVNKLLDPATDQSES